MTAESLLAEIANKPKQKYVKATTPAGLSRYAWLTTPDSFKGKKSYKMDLVYAEEVPKVATIMRLCDEFAQILFDEEYAKRVEKPKGRTPKAKQEYIEKLVLSDNHPFGEVEPEEHPDDFPEGGTYLRFKMGTQYEKSDGSIQKINPRIFDGAGRPITDSNFMLGTGSECVVAFEFVPYVMENVVGCSLRLNHVLVKNLVEFGGGATAEAIFGSDELDEEADDLSQREFASRGETDDGADGEDEVEDETVSDDDGQF